MHPSYKDNKSISEMCIFWLKAKERRNQEMKKAQIQTDRQESLSEISDKKIKIVLKWTENKEKDESLF